MRAQAIQFDIKGIFDPVKRVQFQEFLTFTVSRAKPLNFHEFQRNVGISRRQWDLFREQNCDCEANWAVE